MRDIAIIGAGPAGLSAAIALACEGKSVVLLDQADAVGGQIAHSHLVENVVGYKHGFSGEDFALQSYEQAIGLGVDIRLGHQVVSMLYGEYGSFNLYMPGTPMLDRWGEAHGVKYENVVSARSVLITVGVAPRPIPFPAADDCCCHITNDLHLLPANPDEHVVVYGGGNSAGQAAAYYAKAGCKVTLLSRRPVEETMDGRWIATLLSYNVDLVVGEIQHVNNDTVVFKYSNQTQSLIPHTLHAFTGGEPATGWLQGWVELDSQGYILADEHHCTATYGIFAAGDCVSGSVKKFLCAAGGGCEAAPAIGRYLTDMAVASI